VFKARKPREANKAYVKDYLKNLPSVFSTQEDFGVKQNMMKPSTKVCLALSEACWMKPASTIFCN